MLGAAGTFPEQVDVAVGEQHVQQLQVALHVPGTHPDHLRGRTEEGQAPRPRPPLPAARFPARPGVPGTDLEQLLFVFSKHMDHQQE